MKIPEVMPHRLVDSIVDGLVSGIDGFGNAAISAVQNAGKAVMSGLDKPFSAVTDREGPHRIIDRAADGATGAIRNIASTGFVGSIKTTGKGIMSALDHPLEQIKK